MPEKKFRVLHTSDWHLGKKLFNNERYDEYEAFLAWLLETIRKNVIDLLIVSGDIFDTVTPANYAQGLYFRFLASLASTPCRHVVVIAGNHDSPSLLDAPASLLEAMNIHVVGAPAPNPEDEVFILADPDGEPEAVVCAVPHLREKDVRLFEAGESMEDKEKNLRACIAAHYAQTAAAAEKTLVRAGRKVPVIATGHLYAAGCHSVDGDGARNLYIGALGQINADIFPPVFNYVALGHLHSPQKVGRSDFIRYSGSPLPMGFGERGSSKSVCLVEFASGAASVRGLPVPLFRGMQSVRGDWDMISARLDELGRAKMKNVEDDPWIEVVYEGREIIPDLRSRIDELGERNKLRIVNKTDERVNSAIFRKCGEDESLAELSVEDVFRKHLAASGVPGDEWGGYLDTFREIMAKLSEEDPGA